MNSNLLKEAIADAKAVRATALANAKASLEEAFNSRFSAVFADKLREDSATESTPSVDAPVAETVEPKDATPSKSDGTKGWSSKNTDPSAKPKAKSITPNTIPAAKDGGDATKGWSKDNKGNAMDGTPNGIKETTTENAVEEEAVEETVTNEDLDEIIRELEAEAGAAPADDVPAPGGDAGGLPPAGDEVPGGETPEEQSQEIKSGDTVVISKVEAPAGGTPPPGGEAPPMGGPEAGAPPTEEPAPMEEEEIDLNELLASLNEEAKEDKEDEKEEKHEKEDCDESAQTDEQLKETVAKLNEAVSQRDEAYKTVEYLQKQLNEINLLNAKLLYTNKLFKEFGMNRDQKTKVVEAFDLTKNVREVKMTYANWCESLNLGGNLKKKAVTQSPVGQVTTITEGAASKPVASTKPSKEVITEGVTEMAQRFQKLAGIPVKR